MLGQVLQEYYIMLQEQYQRHLVDFCCWLRIRRCLFPRPMRTSQSHRLERLRICFFCVAKILVGKSQTLELHPTDAGCVFLQNAFLMRRRSVQPSRNVMIIKMLSSCCIKQKRSCCTGLSPVQQLLLVFFISLPAARPARPSGRAADFPPRQRSRPRGPRRRRWRSPRPGGRAGSGAPCSPALLPSEGHW